MGQPAATNFLHRWDRFGALAAALLAQDGGALAAPMEPTTDWDEPVRMSAPLAMWVFAAAAIRATSENEPVQVLDSVMAELTDCTPCRKPSM